MRNLLQTLPLIATIGFASIVATGCEKPAETTATTASTSTSDAKSEAQVEHQSASADKKNNIASSSDADKKSSKGDAPTPRQLPLDLSQSKGNASTPKGSDSIIDKGGLKGSKNEPKDAGELAPQVVTLTPSTLDLGTFSTSEKGTASVTLKNTGDKAVTIERAKASCGCTTSDFQNGTVLQPGETTDISITMDGKGRARKLSKTVTFSITGYPPLRLPVVAETVAYVNLDQNPINIVEGEEFGTITLTSIDEQPFKVLSMLPAITDLPEEAASTQELQLNWSQFWDVVQTTKLTIRLDHPLCKEITASVRLTAEQRQRLNDIIKTRRAGGELPTKDPTRPLNGDQLTQYIKAGRGEQVIQYIKDGLGKYDAVNRGGVTLLSTAAESGYPDTVVALIELGAQVERVDRVNRTPLMYAARSKNPETIQVLLDSGADIQSRDRLGNTPLSWAAGFGTADGVQVLIDAGADANTSDSVLGYSPLTWAAGFGDADAIPILLEAGADVEVHDIAEGRTPLMHAVRTGKAKGVAALIEAGAKVNGIDNSKSTPLHIGAGSNNVTLEKVQILVEAGADINAKNAAGETPLQLAKSRTDDNGALIVEYLSEQTTTE